MSPVFDPARRAPGPELMDDPDLDPAVLAAVLADLSRVNTVTLGRQPVLDFVRRAARRRPEGAPLRVLDLGCGHGDTLRALAQYARRTGTPLVLEGVDLAPGAVAAARAATDPALGIVYRVGDALAEDAGPKPDVIVASLVAHHLEDDAVSRLVAGMERRARIGWCVADLRRARFSFHGFRLLATLARWHPIVRHDGPLSIARSFVEADWRAILATAGLADVARVRRRFPFRLVVERLRERPV